MSDALPIIAKVLNPLMSKHKMRARFPLPVWDDTGSLFGVAIYQDKKMGHQDCLAECTFVLKTSDLRAPAKIKAKAELAIAAIENEIQMTIRPKKKAVRAA